MSLLEFATHILDSRDAARERLTGTCTEKLERIRLAPSSSRRDLLELSVAYCDDFTTVNNVTPGADTEGVANAVNAPVEASISKPATVLS